MRTGESAAAELAWSRTMEFFDKNLRGKSS